MADRPVTRTEKDRDGDITKLCDPGQLWSPVSKANAIREIENGAHLYYDPWNDGQPTWIRVMNGPTGKYLRTDKDSTSRNNLDDLPDC